MAEITRVGGLQIGQDLQYMRYQWTAQRWGWLALVLILGAALLGLLGDGPLSSTSAVAADGSLQIEYERFLRRRSSTDMRIHISPAASSDGTIRLWVGQDFLRNIHIQRISPEPDSVEIGADRQVLVFRTSRPGEPAEICIHFDPASVGPVHGRMGLNDGPPLTFEQFVYP